MNDCAVLDLRAMLLYDVDDNRKGIDTSIQSIPYRSHESSFVDSCHDTIRCIEGKSSLDLICKAEFSPLTSEDLPNLVFDLYHHLDLFSAGRKIGGVRIDSSPNLLPSHHWYYEKLRYVVRAVSPLKKKLLSKFVSFVLLVPIFIQVKFAAFDLGNR